MTFGLRLCAVAFLIADVFSLPAAAALTAEQLASVGVNPPPGATLPLDAPLKDLDGRSTTLRRVVADAPAVIVFADYRCTQLCSPILAVTGQALAKSGLDPGRDYRLIVVGFNPAATAADARQMVAGQIGFDTPVGRATFPLMGSERSVRQLTTSVGYHFVYDAENTRFAHPAALLIVTPGGRLSRLLTGLSITGDDARSALIEAKSGTRGRVRQPGPVAVLRPRRLGRTLWRPSANSACGGWRGDAARHRRGAPAFVARRRKRARVISFLPRQASTFAPQTDALYFTLLGISGAIVILVFALIVVFSDPLPARLLRQAGDVAAAHPARIRDRVDERHPIRLPDAVLVGGVERSVAAFAAARRDGDPRCRQAMDVEDPASERRARDQHASRAGGRAGAARHDFAGCHPLFRGARLSHQAGHPAGALCRDRFPGDRDGRLPSLLHSVLRDRSFRNGRLGRRHEQTRFCRLADGPAPLRRLGRARPSPVHEPRLRGMPRAGRPCPRARA